MMPCAVLSSNFHNSFSYTVETLITTRNLASVSVTKRTPCGQIVLKSSLFCTELEIEGLLKQFFYFNLDLRRCQYMHAAASILLHEPFFCLVHWLIRLVSIS